MARWMEACGTGSLLGTFWEIWPLAGARGAGSSVGPRVNLSCISLNQCLYLWNGEEVGSSWLGRHWRRCCLEYAADLAPAKHRHPSLGTPLSPAPLELLGASEMHRFLRRAAP